MPRVCACPSSIRRVRRGHGSRSARKVLRSSCGGHTGRVSDLVEVARRAEPQATERHSSACSECPTSAGDWRSPGRGSRRTRGARASPSVGRRHHSCRFRTDGVPRAAGGARATAADQSAALSRRPGGARRVAVRRGTAGAGWRGGSCAESNNAAATSSCSAGRLWADLMRRAFEVDVLACPRCGGRLRLVALLESGPRDRADPPALGVAVGSAGGTSGTGARSRAATSPGDVSSSRPRPSVASARLSRHTRYRATALVAGQPGGLSCQ